MRLADTHVLAPHFKRRLSGVTSTVIQLAPIQARMMGERGCGFVTLGPGLPPSMPRVAGVPGLKWLGLVRRTRTGTRRVWHARRNVEMLPAILLRYVLRAPLAILFTSAAQREHSAYTRWLIGRMDRVVATSKASACFLHVDPARLDVVTHGIDIDRFRPATDRDALRRSLGLDPDRLYLGCFGRVRANKGTGDLVEALLRVLPDRPEWTALIAGRTTAEHAAFRRDLEARIAAAGLSDRVRFLGEVESVDPFYAALDLYVAPSREEGFGLTPLEAMASGAPVLTSDAGAYPDMVVPAVGRIVARGDVEALAREMAALTDDPLRLEAMGRAARAHVEARFPLEREAERLCAIYEEMLAE